MPPGWSPLPPMRYNRGPRRAHEPLDSRSRVRCDWLPAPSNRSPAASRSCKSGIHLHGTGGRQRADGADRDRRAEPRGVAGLRRGSRLEDRGSRKHVRAHDRIRVGRNGPRRHCTRMGRNGPRDRCSGTRMGRHGQRRTCPAPAWGAGSAPASASAPVWGATAATPQAVSPTPAPAWGAAASTPPAVAAPASTQGWFDTQAAGLSFSIRADGAPLGSTVLAVGDAVGLPVIVDPDLADLSITLTDSDITLADLGALLLDTMAPPCPLPTASSPSPTSRPSWTGTTTPSRLPRHPRASHARWRAGRPPAATWCALGATERGTASVVGGAIMFEDAPAALDEARSLTEELSITATALWADDSTRSEGP